MYRLLIVDDERVIADGLSEVFSKFDIELDVCKAYSAYEALEIMNRNRVDIVISDIRMPGMDGIQLMDHICREWPHCKIIFLTGYDDFDYVYKAIQRPSVNYLLKTEGYRKVKEMVRSAVHQLDDEWFVKDVVKQSQEQRHTLETLLQSDYFRHVMKGSRSIEELHTDFETLGISLDPAEPVILVLGVLDMAEQKDSYVKRQKAGLAVKEIADSFLRDKVKQVTVLDRYHDLLWLIQPAERTDKPEQMESIIRYLEGTFELIERSGSDMLDISLSITLGVQPIDWVDLSLAYDRLRLLQTDRVGDGIHMVQTVLIKEPIEESSGNKEAACQHVTMDDTELLSIHLESGRKQEFFDVFDRIADSIGDGHQLAPSSAMQCYYSVAYVLLSYITRVGMSESVNIKRLMSFDDHHSWMAGFEFLKQTAEQLFAHRKSGEQNRAAQAVQQIQAYIEDHLDENLSLIRLSEIIHFNSSYISRMFKQVTGVNLSEYLEERRIRKAKELLKTHDYKIAEVGAKIGYHSPHSFTRFFKKAVGLTPQEYRDGRSEHMG